MLEHGKMDRDLVEFVVIDQLVPKEHLLRKIDAAVDFTQLAGQPAAQRPLLCQSVQKLYPVSSRGNSRPAA